MTWLPNEKRDEAMRKAIEMVPVSRRELARRAGVSHSTLNRIVNGAQRASLDNTLDVYRALKEVREVCDEAMQRLLDADDFSTPEED